MTLIKSLSDISMLLILMTISFRLKKLSNCKISYEPNVTLIKSAYEFINVTLVCDDDRYKAHKGILTAKLILVFHLSLLINLFSHWGEFLTLQWVL